MINRIFTLLSFFLPRDSYPGPFQREGFGQEIFIRRFFLTGYSQVIKKDYSRAKYRLFNPD